VRSIGYRRARSGLSETIAALAFYDPREVVQWDQKGARITVSSDLPYRSVLAIKEISTLQDGTIRIRFHDRRAALMDLARLRGIHRQVRELPLPRGFGTDVPG
jgi:hypothetical protein